MDLSNSRISKVTNKDQLIENTMAMLDVLIKSIQKVIKYNLNELENDGTDFITLGKAIFILLHNHKDDEDDLIAQTCCRLLDMLPDELLDTIITSIPQGE